jgi:serine/threonine protein kinase/Tol biopolymer transport system component
MDRERWQKVDEIFKSALELPTEERAAFVGRACAGDEELRADVLSLIEHDREASMLERPAVEEATRLLAAEGERERSLAGKTFGPYRIVSRLGAGGMGEVYLAVHERTGRKVALKLLPARHTGDEQRVRRFQQEARAVLALNHPNIVTVYDIEQAGGEFVIASELIEGETLRARVSRGALAHSEALDVAAQVAAALAAAHAEGIVHRDVKPENVMLRPDGFVKVLDFGLAKLAEKSDAAGSEAPTLARVSTDPGVVMGTVGYMSPEQARGRETDARTDIWSLGVVLYEMLTARTPFAGETPTDTLAAIIGKEPPPLTRYRADAPEALEWVVTKALTKDRDGRYQTAKEILSDLKRLKQQLEFAAAASRSADVPASVTTAGDDASARTTDAEANAARTDGAGAGTTQGSGGAMRQTSSAGVIIGELKRHRRGMLAAAALLAFALAAGGYGLYKFFGRRAASFETMQLTRLSDTAQAADAAVSPKGDFVVFVKDDSGRQSLWLRQTSAASSVQIAPPAEGMRYVSPLFSRAGDAVYFLKLQQGSNRAALYRANMLGGDERKLAENVSTQDSRGNFSFSPDSRQVAFVRLDDGLNRSLVIHDLEGGEERTVLSVRLPRFVAGPQWSPDGKTIACTAGSFDARGAPGSSRAVEGVRVEDGAEVPIPNQSWTQVRALTWLQDSSGLIISAGVGGGPLQLWHLSYPDGASRRITNDLSDYWGASLTADSSSLFSVQFNLRLNLWAATPEKNSSWSLAQITQGEGGHEGEYGVSWTPDGRVVYYSTASGTADIWIADADGKRQRRLTTGGINIFPAASPDGRYVIFNSDRSGVGVVWRIDTDGTHLTQLTKEGGLAHFSPDGRWVYYYVVGALFKVPVEGGEPVKIQTPEGSLVTAPVPSPDGRLLACNYLERKPNAQFRLAVIPEEGGAPLRVFDTPTSPIKTLRWMPDGSAILYIASQRGVTNVWKQPLDGGPPAQLTSFTSDDVLNFDVARDGRLLLARGDSTSSVVMLGGWR